MKNDCGAGRPQMTVQYSACALHAVYLRLQKHPKNTIYLLILYAKIVQQTHLKFTLYVICLCYSLFFLGRVEIQNILN